MFEKDPLKHHLELQPLSGPEDVVFPSSGLTGLEYLPAILIFTAFVEWCRQELNVHLFSLVQQLDTFATLKVMFFSSF